MAAITPEGLAASLADKVMAAPIRGHRKVVAIAGPPASGKSTLARQLAAHLSDQGPKTVVVPMDGFHLDNRILAKKDLLSRKGAPETFDSGGFLRLASVLATEQTLYFPKFDRQSDIAIAGAGQITPDCQCVIVEGNYLLFDAPIWRDLIAQWDLSIRLDVERHILRKRLVGRWHAHGLSQEQAVARAESNDLPNAALVSAQSMAADITIPISSSD